MSGLSAQCINPHGLRANVIKSWGNNFPDEFDIKIADCKKERDRLLAKTTDFNEKERLIKIYNKRIELFKQKQSKKYGKDSNESQPSL